MTASGEHNETKVLHLINRLEAGGVQRHVLDLSAGLPSFGFHSHIAAFLPAGSPLRGEDHCTHLPLYGRDGETKSLGGLFRSVMLLHRLIREQGIQLIHAHSRYAMFLAFLLRILHPSLRYLYTVHSNFTNLRYFPFYPRNVICSSEIMCDLFLASSTMLRAPQTSVIPHGVDLPVISRKHNEHDEVTCTFLYVGRLAAQKGVELLLAATAQLQASDSIRLIIRGEGPLSADVEKAVKALPHEVLTFDGFKQNPFEDAEGVDALLFPSTALEGLPYSILEAFAHGIPVLAHALPVLEMLVKEGRHGFIVRDMTSASWADAMRHAARQRGKLREMGDGCRAYVEQTHQLGDMIEKTSSVYRQLLG